MRRYYQRHDRDEQPSIDEEVVATDLNDLDQERGDGQRQHKGDQCLLDRVLHEETDRLRRTEMSRVSASRSQSIVESTCLLNPCFSSSTK